MIELHVLTKVFRLISNDIPHKNGNYMVIDKCTHEMLWHEFIASN